jgi:hypothetical protein
MGERFRLEDGKSAVIEFMEGNKSEKGTALTAEA